MGTLIVEGLSDEDDVVALVHYLVDRVAAGYAEEICAEGSVVLRPRGAAPTPEDLHSLVWFDDDEDCLDPDHRDGCSCRRDAADTNPLQGVLVDPERALGPVEYVPCPDRGTHTALTDCWMCWCDVQRGVVDTDDVIAPASREDTHHTHLTTDHERT